MDIRLLQGKPGKADLLARFLTEEQAKKDKNLDFKGELKETSITYPKDAKRLIPLPPLRRTAPRCRQVALFL